MFKEFFMTFDNEMNSLGIESYGISITTLEEVFLKINQEFKINITSGKTEANLEDDVAVAMVDEVTPFGKDREHG
jgi:hypothetical protein